MSDHGPLFRELFAGLERLAPGSRESTRRAWGLLPPWSASPRILELGAGTGAATLVLARESGGWITAVDIDEPSLAVLRTRAEQGGLGEQITTLEADMARLPLAPGSYDVVWCEGAIYIVGFASGLARWKPLLAPGGWLVASELCWLVDDPPEEARAYWRAAYPGMTRPAECQRLLAEAGFVSHQGFVLPAEDWDEYYQPLAMRLESFRARHAENPTAAEVAQAEEAEIDLWRRHGASYGYVFFLGQVA